jgi:YD repeat-containing protein
VPRQIGARRPGRSCPNRPSEHHGDNLPAVCAHGSALLRRAAQPRQDHPTTQTYDAFGNVATFADAGDVGATDDVAATIAYTNCQPAYIIKPNRIEVRGNGAVMRLREADIDCTSGNVRQVRQRLADLSAAVTDLTYFGNGNLQTVTGPANLNNQRYTLTYEYDPDAQTHVARITDIFGLSSQANYDLRFGKVQTTVDTNGQQTTNLYDAVGRLKQIFGPYEQSQATATLSFDYAAIETPAYDPQGNLQLLTLVPNAITRHVDKNADGQVKGTIDTILFTDGLKRVIQTKKDATVLENAAAPQDRMIVSGQVRFDAFGRTFEQRYPTVEPKTSENVNRAFNPGVDSVPPTTMTYDVLDRNLRTTIPDNTFTTIAYGFGPDRSGAPQFETVVTDANKNAGLPGAVKRTYRNVRELITSVKELNNAGAQTLWTSYVYDALKQITQVVDDKQNTTTVTYDNFGRRTVINNPDTGRTETRYDLASNVTKKITANLQAQAKSIDYNYDFSRLTSADGEVVTNEYDSGGNLAAAAGVKAVVASSQNHRYHYLQKLFYDKFEQRALVEQGNGVKTAYSYNDQTRRLSNLNAVRQGNTIFQNLSYSYDKVGNVLGLKNDVALPQANDYGGPSLQRFEYDDLYRLTKAQGVFPANVSAPTVDKNACAGVPTSHCRVYDLGMGYDSIHNIQAKNQRDTRYPPGNTQGVVQKKTDYDFTYLYAASGPASVRPHAPTHIGVRT